jgi:aryl-alcohol dehydrogenase-like predicted oxidoreductase
VGLGGNNFGRRCDLAQTRRVVDAALDAGMNLIDTADVYNKGASETLLGDVLKGRRHDVILATKVGVTRSGTPTPSLGGGSRRHIMQAVEASLRRLQTDYIDLYSFHFPDPWTPIDETMSALDQLVKDGKVRYLGTSNFAGWQIVEADWIARTSRRTRFISAQNSYSLINRGVELEVAPACLEHGVGLVAYHPLAQGFLTGKYRRDEPPTPNTRLSDLGVRMRSQDFDLLESLNQFATAHGVSLLQLALGYLLAQPALSMIVVGATTPEQVQANVAAADWRPAADEVAELRSIVNGPAAPSAVTYRQ